MTCWVHRPDVLFSRLQWLHGADSSNGNLISGNTIATHGSECVDIKEGSYGNIVEYNTCSYEMEEKSGCMNIRGDTNVIRWVNLTKYRFDVGEYK